VRVSQWSNPAAIIPPVFTCWAPPCPTLVRITFASTNSNAETTAAWCAAYTSRRVTSSPNAHSTDTDLGTVNVMSYPTTACRPLPTAPDSPVAAAAAVAAKRG